LARNIKLALLSIMQALPSVKQLHFHITDQPFHIAVSSSGSSHRSTNPIRDPRGGHRMATACARRGKDIVGIAMTFVSDGTGGRPALFFLPAGRGSGGGFP